MYSGNQISTHRYLGNSTCKKKNGIISEQRLDYRLFMIPGRLIKSVLLFTQNDNIGMAKL